MYVKLFNSILDSSVWLEDLPTRVLWITMLAMADEHGIVRASIGGLAKRAGIAREECEAGLTKFLAPDPDSRTPDHEGRRIEPVKGGWLVLNHAAYREIRTGKQRADAERQARHREKLKAEADSPPPRDRAVTSVTVTDVTTTASASAAVSEMPVEKQQPARREDDPVDGVLAEAGFPSERFTEGDLALIRGFIRSQRSPLAVTQVLRAHLLDEDVEPRALALAVREYAALADERGFRARHFGGFVKRARGHVAQAPGRVQARQEERFITDEDREAERSRREEADTSALIADFERTHGDEFEALKAQAEAMVSSNFKGIFRAPMVRAALAKLIRERLS